MFLVHCPAYGIGSKWKWYRVDEGRRCSKFAGNVNDVINPTMWYMQKDITKSPGGEKYPTNSKKIEDQIDWSHLA
jgi:hypothetical protein